MEIDNVIYVILTVSVILISTRYIIKKWNSISVKSNIDNQYYIVRNNKNKQESADTLALINMKVMKLINHLKETEKNNRNVDLLISRYTRHSLMENIELDNTTYTINKGTEISVCLSTRDTHEKIYDINKLMFVIIHELAHVGSKSYGHNAEFRVFFIYLLKKSIEIGIYKYEDYSNQPAEYCGITINTTPI